MARTVTLAQLRSRTQQLANVESDPLVTAAEVNALINLHLTEVYDLLVLAGPADYYSASQNIQTIGGTIPYALPADFLSLTKVYAQETSDILRPVYPINDSDRMSFKSPAGSWTMVIEYVPTPTALVNDGDTFDGVDGWDELVSAKAARDILVKREGDPSVVMAIIERATKRLRSASTPRDRGGPKMIHDLEVAYVWPRSVRIDGYRLRAGNIEFYTSVWGWP